MVNCPWTGRIDPIGVNAHPPGQTIAYEACYLNSREAIMSSNSFLIMCKLWFLHVDVITMMTLGDFWI